MHENTHLITNLLCRHNCACVSEWPMTLLLWGENNRYDWVVFSATIFCMLLSWHYVILPCYLIKVGANGLCWCWLCIGDYPAFFLFYIPYVLLFCIGYIWTSLCCSVIYCWLVGSKRSTDLLARRGGVVSTLTVKLLWRATECYSFSVLAPWSVHTDSRFSRVRSFRCKIMFDGLQPNQGQYFSMPWLQLEGNSKDVGTDVRKKNMVAGMPGPRFRISIVTCGEDGSAVSQRFYRCGQWCR